MASNTDIIQSYVDLLILQYKGMPKAEATIQAFLKTLCIFELIDGIEDGYDIETAEGVQLDILGKYIGVSRIITGISFTRKYFGFMGYGDNPSLCSFAGFMGYGELSDNILTFSNGDHFSFSDGKEFGIINNVGYSEIPPDVQMLGYGDNKGSILTLIDSEYRTLLRFRILMNYSNCSMKDIDDFLFKYYGNDIYITDNFNRTITYTFPTQSTRLSAILKFTDCLPRSAGTEILLEYEPHT